MQMSLIFSIFFEPKQGIWNPFLVPIVNRNRIQNIVSNPRFNQIQNKVHMGFDLRTLMQNYFKTTNQFLRVFMGWANLSSALICGKAWTLNFGQVNKWVGLGQW